MEKTITTRVTGRSRRFHLGLVLTVALTLWGTAWEMASAATPSALLHNSVNTTLNAGSMKWAAAGGWGVAGGQYGEFTCATCHTQSTGNIARIRSVIAVPDTSKGNIPGSAVMFPSKTEYGTYSSAGYTSSTHICEVCHSQTAYHKYSQTKARHEDVVGIKDCTVCHLHNQGFRPAGGCLICHSRKIGNRAAVGEMFGANSHHIQGVAVTDKHCYQCHWEANADGSINGTYHGGGANPGAPIRLVIYGAGARPTTFIEGTTAISYTANGTRSEMAKITSHCVGCHSDQNIATQPFGDGKTPSTYAWDKSSIATKYGDTGTTPWGKYSGGKTTPKSTVTKAFSAHGNAAANQGGWNTSETWPNTRGTVSVLCFDCHNSHGSTVAGITTSYASATTNGGILKDTTAGVGGYAQSYRPTAGGSAADHNLYNPGAGLCFDCHLNANAGTTPWGYSGTFGASQQILGYMDSAYFGTGIFGNQLRYPYKGAPGNMGGHFGASSALASPPDAAHQIGGLCTPCHDPHGVSPTLGANKIYGVPLLKGTWLTSPYKEDAATADNKAYSGGKDNKGPYTSSAYEAAINSYHIDQNTFASGSITQTEAQFAGLCLNCHAKTALTNGVTHTWKSKDRIHEAVKGWKTANGTIKHNYSCSKCHTAHNADLPRLMVTNCLDAKHRGRVTNNPSPVTSSSGSGNRDRGNGKMPGIYDSGQGRDGGSRSGGWGDSGDNSYDSSTTYCHDKNDATQKWNLKTQWALAGSAPTVPVIQTVSPATCASSCTVPMAWTASVGTSSNIQYLVQVSKSSTFATIDYNSGWISATSWSRSLATNTTYYWRVQARDGGTTTLVSAWSQTGTFSLTSTPTPTAPTTPALNTVTPATCASSCAVPMTWAASVGTSVQYQVQVSTNSSFSTVNASSGWISGTSWTSSSLATNATYYWRVQARNGTATTLVSAWSQTGSFQLSSTAPAVAPTTPTLKTATPGTCSSSCAVPVAWNASVGSGSIQYQVQVSTSTSFSTLAASSGWISGTSWTSPSLATSTTYYWRVQARDGVSTSLVSGWSSTGTFKLSKY